MWPILPSWAVGISIFASLLSTITYLGLPGEMFRTGIGFLTRQLSIPIVLIVVWCLWIPFFMRLKLTSAYEYLDKRFGYGGRLYSSLGFIGDRVFDLGGELSIPGLAEVPSPHAGAG